MSRRGARSQAAEKRRLVRAFRRTGRPSRSLPGPSTRKHLRPLLTVEATGGIIMTESDMNAATKPCPACGATMTKETGVISEPVCAKGSMDLTRKARPATFYACWACEHCEEV